MQLSKAAYKELVRADLEHGSSVWDPQGVFHVELEHLQAECAARFVTNVNFFKQGTMELGV